MRARPNPRPVGLALVIAGLAISGLAAAGGSGAPPRGPDRAAEAVLAGAREQIGDAYQWAGTGPDVWDCSGLTYTLWRTAGGVASIPRTSREQQSWATPIRGEDLLPGDLIFFGDPVSHVSIYVGDDQLIDASSSRKGVVQRGIWTSDVIRYGRVPRSGAPVTPLPAGSPSPNGSASPSPATAADPATSSPTPAPKPTSTAKPSAKPTSTSKPSAKPTSTPKPSAAGSPRPVPSRGHTSRTPTDATSAAFIGAARSARGAAYEPGRSSPTYDAPGLVRWAWWRTTKEVLPADVVALEARTAPVRLADLAVGDLVFYGRPAVHVGIYVGDGSMVDASKVLKKVSEREVFSSETVRFARITR